MVFNEDPPTLVSSPPAMPPSMRKRGLPMYFIRNKLSFISRYLKPRCKKQVEDAYFKKLLKSIPALQNVHLLDVTIKPWNSVGFDRFLSMKTQFFVVWSTPWAANLTHINLDCDLCLIHPHWPKDIIFPNLTSLMVRFQLSGDRKREVLTDFLRPLIVNHSGSLTTLGLKEKTTWAYDSIPFLLQEEIVLPKLEKVIIGKNVSLYRDAEAQQMIRFMKRHARTLKELACIMFTTRSHPSESSIYGYCHEAGDSILNYYFPNLETLTLSSHAACFDLMDNTLAIHYAHRPMSRLRSLTLKTMILSRAAVVTHLWNSSRFFATSLNQLEYLSSRLYRDIRGPAYRGYVRNPHSSPQVDTTDFHSALIHLDSTTLSLFVTWNLRELDLVPFFCNTQLDPASRKVLLKVLPIVHSFCEMGRKEYATVEVDPGEVWSR